MTASTKERTTALAAKSVLAKTQRTLTTASLFDKLCKSVGSATAKAQPC